MYVGKQEDFSPIWVNYEENGSYWNSFYLIHRRNPPQTASYPLKIF